jgi:hypothetical protein
LSSLSLPFPTACLLGKGLRSPSSFGHEDLEVEIWMMSNSLSFGARVYALRLHLVMRTGR